MFILLHVIVALSSIAVGGYTLYKPTKTKLQVSYGLVAATIASGTYVTISTHAHMIQACTTGLIYLGFIFSCLIAASRKLAKDKIDA